MSMTTFGFDGNGATQLVRNKANASCILDLTGSRDVTVYGISLDGLSKSAQSTVHGVKVVGAKNVLIANCRINACNARRASGQFHWGDGAGQHAVRQRIRCGRDQRQRSAGI